MSCLLYHRLSGATRLRLKLSQMNLPQILRSRVPPDRLQQMIIDFLKEIEIAHTHKKIYNKRRFPTMNKDPLCYSFIAVRKQQTKMFSNLLVKINLR